MKSVSAGLPSAQLPPPWAPVLIAASVIFVAKLTLIAAFGSSVPFWDQWDAEADVLYRAFVEGTLSWEVLFRPHNEHRIVLTKLLALGLLVLNGGVWEPLLQMIVNAAIHTAAISVLLFVLCRVLPAKRRIALAAFVAVLFALPFSWENTLAGFQSQFYFLLLFSVLFLWTMQEGEVGRGMTWWGGVLSAAMALFSLASGSLTLLAGAATLSVRQYSERLRDKRLLAWAMLFAGVAIYWMWITPHLAKHDALRAKNVGELIRAAMQAAAWPLNWSWAPVVNAPILIYAVSCWRQRTNEKSNLFVLALGFWLILQMASIGYGRAVGVVASRYLDIYLLALVLNAWAVLRLLPGNGLAGSSVWRGLACLAWGLLVARGVFAQSSGAWAGAFDRSMMQRIHLQHVRDYLSSGDSRKIFGKPFMHIPHPDVPRLRRFLDSAAIRSVLPTVLVPENSARVSPGVEFLIAGLRDYGRRLWAYETSGDDPADPGGRVASVAAILEDRWGGHDYEKAQIECLRVIGSHAGSDVHTGRLVVRLQRGESLWYRTGPASARQRIRVRNANGFYAKPWHMPAGWALLEFSNPRYGEWIEIEFADEGSGWGEWSAIALSDCAGQRESSLGSSSVN